MSRPSITLSASTATRRSLPSGGAPARPWVIGSRLDELTTLDIGGARIHLVDERAARRVISHAVRETTERPLSVCSVNLDHIHHLRRPGTELGADGSVRWLNLIDGAPIARQAQRITGIPYPRLAGSDIIAGVLTDVGAAGLAVAFVGGFDEVTDALRRKLALQYPGLRFAGHWTPTRAELSSPEDCLVLCEQIRASRADVVVVCLGKPRQEVWISTYGEATGARVLLAFGAVVDFLADRVSRAPQWMRRAGAEWMWRLLLEPRRLARRYLIEGPPAYMAVRRSRRIPDRA